jgi:NAD-dependent DNA ligase
MLKTTNVDTLVNQLRKYNISYRKGMPLLSDKEFDALEDQLREIDPYNAYFETIGIDPLKISTHKAKLPAPMFSMNKLKTAKEIQLWIKRHGLEKELFVLTPKYDGFSILADGRIEKFYSRGDGVEGNDISSLFKLVGEEYNHKSPIMYFGEGIILKDIFENKYTKEVLGEDDGYENPRNMVASLFNPETKHPDKDKLKDVHFIRYGTDKEDLSKDKQLQLCNKVNRIKVPYLVVDASILTEEILQAYFFNWGKEFELDGIIIDVNNAEVRKRLGRETNGNPKYARAFKGNFETVKETWIKSITWQTSKDGYLTPVAQIEPVRLDGAEVSNVTLYNAKTVRDNKLGILAKIRIKRSGGVIPKFLECIEPALVVNIPKSIDKVLTEWDENEVELRLIKKTDKWKIQENLHFFRTFDIEEIGEPTIEAFFNAGYKTPKDILMMTENDIAVIPGYGRKKAIFFLKEFKEKIKSGVDLERLMHASNIVKGLGEKTLKLINNHIERSPEDEEINEQYLIELEGIGKEKADMYLTTIGQFWNWYEEQYQSIIKINVMKTKEEVVATGDKMKGEKVCFSGFRDKEMEDSIVNNGGEIVSGVSRNTTILIVKDIESGSSKIQKAEQLGIKIYTREKFKI